MRNIIRKSTPVELLAAIYENEGWVRKEGESRTKRANGQYIITADLKRNQYVARRR